MFGWINDCCESLVVTKFGLKKWHEIKEKAGCSVNDGGFIRHKYYTDESSVDLVVAVSSVLGISVHDVLEVFGQYFMEFTRDAGYDNLLSCQGSNLRLWLSNLNALHDHLQETLPRGRFPEFWSEDDVEVKGTIILYYFSERGSLFVPFVLGLVKEVARYHFDLEITMELLQTQGENDCKYSAWRIGTVNPAEIHKLTASILTSSRDGVAARQGSDIEDVLREADIEAKAEASACPFHKMQKLAKSQTISERAANRFWDRARVGTVKSLGEKEGSQGSLNIGKSSEGTLDGTESPTSPIQLDDRISPQIEDGDINEHPESCKRSLGAAERSIEDHPIHEPQEDHKITIREGPKMLIPDEGQPTDSFITNDKMQQIFPYHVVLDHRFIIIQAGTALSKLIGLTNLVGRSAKDIFEIRRPVLGTWDWAELKRFADQTFKFQTSVGRKKSQLKANFINLSTKPKRVLVTIAPDAKNTQQLSAMGLTMSDLPMHTFQRDAIFLGEHMYSGIRSAHKLDKLSRKLVYEHNLSNSLLYSMLPQEVATILRAGRAFEPRHHENVTLFFSDVVGFTDICSEMPPWDVIDMLNRLYTVMDFLAERFFLYKVETIGDAYMCCSGLPEENEMHAEDVANFAIAVRECVQLVKSPLTNEPIRVRMGIHSGSCMSGVVGSMTPHYCLFGDMVNTTSRHESTGMPGKIHCSSITYGNLTHFTEYPEHYNFTPRGLVDMKGKGQLFTYWLDSAGENNPHVGLYTLEGLRDEVQEMLDSKTWKKRQYFERRISGSTHKSLQEFSSDDDHIANTDDESQNLLQNQHAPPEQGFQMLDTISVSFLGELDDDLSQQIQRRKSGSLSRRQYLSHTIEDDGASETISETPEGSKSNAADLNSSYRHLRAAQPSRNIKRGTSHRSISTKTTPKVDDVNGAGKPKSKKSTNTNATTEKLSKTQSVFDRLSRTSSRAVTRSRLPAKSTGTRPPLTKSTIKKKPLRNATNGASKGSTPIEQNPTARRKLTVFDRLSRAGTSMRRTKPESAVR